MEAVPYPDKEAPVPISTPPRPEVNCEINQHHGTRSTHVRSTDLFLQRAAGGF